MAILVLVVNNEAYILANLKRIVPFENEALIFGFNKCKRSRNAGDDRAHTASDGLHDSLVERKLLLVEEWIFGDCEDDLWGMPSHQLLLDVIGEEFVAGNGKPVLRIEIFEMRQLGCEFMAQPWIRENLAIAIALIALYERSKRNFMEHRTSLTRNVWVVDDSETIW